MSERSEASSGRTEAPAPGCLIDGHHGWHAHRMMLELARDLGWPMWDTHLNVVDAYDPGHDAEAEHTAAEWVLEQGGLLDQAENWLNQNVAEEGSSFGWHEGEFFYMTTEWWEEET